MSVALSHNLQQLPPPGGSQLEVLFRRMLLQCACRVRQQQQQQAGDGGGSGSSSSGDWRSDAKFHCVLEALQDRLYELEQAGADARPGPDVLQLYRAAVRALAAELQQPQLPDYSLRLSAVHTSGTGGTAGQGGATAAAGQQQGAAQLAGGSIHDLLNSTHTTAAAAAAAAAASAAGGGGGAAGGSTGTRAPAAGARAPSSSGGGDGPPGGREGGPGFSLSSRTQGQLRTQQHLQDELTDELLDLGSELKSSTLAMQNAIRYRGKLLDEAEVHLVHSAENAKVVAAKAKQQLRQGNWNLCHTFIIVLSVTLIFSFMLVAIRVSSMVGLKGQRA